MAAGKEHEELIASLFDAETLYQEAPCGYLSFYPDDTIIKVNQTLLRLLGFEEPELVGVKKFPQLISKGGNIHYEMIFRPLVTMNGNVKELSYDILHKDGYILPVLLSASTVRDAGGAIVAINAVITDNTDRKKYEAELLIARKQAESEKLTFQFLADQIPEMIWTADEQGRINYVNQRFTEYFRLTERKVDLNSVLSQIHPEDRAAFSATWISHIRSGQDLHAELRLAYEAEKYKWHQVKAIAYRAEGEIRQWFGSCVDIEVQVRALKQKDEFISIASHELKTPLTSLTATLQLLERQKEGTLPPAVSKMIEQANRNIKKMNSLVADLLNVSRLREGQLSLRKTSFDLVQMVGDAIDELKQQTVVPIQLRASEPIMVNADGVRIEQVVINFVNNAIKYAPGSESIQIVFTETDHKIKVSVIDQGPGIPHEKLPFIFDRYYRVNDSGAKYSGLGLGLYICAEIIRRHHGEIGAESELGKGTTFWFTLPAAV